MPLNWAKQMVDCQVIQNFALALKSSQSQDSKAGKISRQLKANHVLEPGEQTVSNSLSFGMNIYSELTTKPY